jgi:hypothetical protein
MRVSLLLLLLLAACSPGNKGTDWDRLNYAGTLCRDNPSHPSCKEDDDGIGSGKRGGKGR